MKVLLLKRQLIESFIAKNPQSRKLFNTWLPILKYADWTYPVDILQTFKSAELLANGSNRVTFDIGSKYKVVCHHHFHKTIAYLFVCWVGTTAQYIRLTKARKQYTATNFETVISKVIKNKKQYIVCCKHHDTLLVLKNKTREQEEIQILLSLLLEKLDAL